MCSSYANVVYPNRSQGIIPAIGHDDVALLHEGDKVVLYPAAKGRPFLHAWLIDKNGAPSSLTSSSTSMEALWRKLSEPDFIARR